MTIQLINLLIRYLIFSLGCILLSGCSNMRVFTDADPDMDVLIYKTYSWSSRKEIESKNDPLLYNELTDKRIRKAVDQQLQQNGYSQSDETPDLKVHYHIVVKDKAMIHPDDPDKDAYSPYWLQGAMSSYLYQEGTLIIDLMETKTHHLIWRGWAVDVIEAYDGRFTDENLDKAIRKIFKGYPKHPR